MELGRARLGPPVLSVAIRTGAHPDPLDAAMAALNLSQTAESDDMYCRARIHKLHRAFPHIGASVRQWPTLATELEGAGRVIPRIKPWQTVYRQEIHKSLWQACVDLHNLGYSNDRIADLLERHGL